METGLYRSVRRKHVGFLRSIDEFEMIDGVADAIQKINESGYLAVVVTNQPVDSSWQGYSRTAGGDSQ